MANVVWMVNHYASLPRESGGTRHYWLARGLHKLGWDVRLIRSGPQAVDFRYPHVEVVDGIEVTTIHGPGNVRGTKRIVGWVEFAVLLKSRRATRHLPRPDIVLGSTVHLGAAWAARSLARRHDAAFVFEVRDLWPETLIALGSLGPNSAAARAMRQLEGSLARSADLIVSPLSGVGRYMSQTHGIPASQFLWVSNGVNYSNYVDSPRPARGPLRLQYFGSIGTANDVGLIIDAVALANLSRADPVSLQIRGAGPELASLQERVRNDPSLTGLVSFGAPVPSSAVPQAMAWGNALVMTVRDLPDLYRYGISMNKLFDYLASGRWIIMGSSVARNPIADAPGLTLCRPTAECLGEAIALVARMTPAERDTAGSANAKLAQRSFDYEALSVRLCQALNEIVHLRKQDARAHSSGRTSPSPSKLIRQPPINLDFH